MAVIAQDLSLVLGDIALFVGAWIEVIFAIDFYDKSGFWHQVVHSENVVH